MKNIKRILSAALLITMILAPATMFPRGGGRGGGFHGGGGRGGFHGGRGGGGWHGGGRGGWHGGRGYYGGRGWYGRRGWYGGWGLYGGLALGGLLATYPWISRQDYIVYENNPVVIYEGHRYSPIIGPCPYHNDSNPNHKCFYQRTPDANGVYHTVFE